MTLRLTHLLFLAAALTLAACTPADPSSTSDAPVNNFRDFLDTGDKADAEDDTPDDNNPLPDATPDAPTPAGPQLRIATWNVERLFDTVCDTGDCGVQAYEPLPSESFYNARIQRIADAIEALDVDIVLLQEIEKQSNLDDLLTQLGGRYTVAAIGEDGYAASLDTAVIARGELLDITAHDPRLVRPSGGNTSFARKLLEVRLDIDGTQVIVFVAHFKAKSSDDPERRLAEALATHTIVTDTANEEPDALVVLGGDLNDTPGSDPINALEDSGDLLRVASDRPDDDVWTYVYRNETQAIDHLFIAQRARGGVYLPASANAIRDGASYGGSDHAALVATFILP